MKGDHFAVDGSRLRTFRRQHGWAQEDLAYETDQFGHAWSLRRKGVPTVKRLHSGISRKTINKLECSRGIASARTLYLLARALNCDQADLLVTDKGVQQELKHAAVAHKHQFKQPTVAPKPVVVDSAVIAQQKLVTTLAQFLEDHFQVGFTVEVLAQKMDATVAEIETALTKLKNYTPAPIYTDGYWSRGILKSHYVEETNDD